MLQIPAALQAAMIEQFNFERYSADLYFGMAAALDAINFEGFAAYLNKRACEEREHAAKFAAYLADRNTRPILAALPAPVIPSYAGLMDAPKACFKAAAIHEEVVTERINVLQALAYQVEDPQTWQFLAWFVAEQTEEMATLDVWLTKFELASGNGAALLILDHEAGG